MERSMKLTGRVWLIDDANHQLIDDIDTDMIFHNKHLHITELEEMAPHAFGNLDGWKDFPKKAEKGDILVLGKNFGAGSSRQQAVDCFAALGCQLLLGESFGAIYKRNAINSGMALIEAPDIGEDIAEKRLETGDTISVNLETRDF